MKNLLTLLALFTLISCSKDDPNPAEQIENNTNLLTGEWISNYYFYNNERNISPQPIILNFNSSDKSILWTQSLINNSVDTTFTVFYKIV